MEDWVTIRNLKKKRPDLGTRKIAELLGVSRNTVRRTLRSDEIRVISARVRLIKTWSRFLILFESLILSKNKK